MIVVINSVLDGNIATAIHCSATRQDQYIWDNYLCRFTDAILVLRPLKYAFQACALYLFHWSNSRVIYKINRTV